jgi:hypothetical protein
MHAPATELTDVDVGLDKLLGIAWQLVDDDTLTASASLMSVVAAKLDAARAAFADAVDRSGVWAENKHANAAAMLNTLAANRHPAAAKRDVLLARRLREMPHVTEALHGGHITADHARLLGECLHARFDGQFVDFEEELVARAMELSYDDFVKLVNAWKQWADESIEDERDIKDRKTRELHLSRSFKNRGILNGTLTPIARSLVDKELRRLVQLLFQQDWADATERLGEGKVTYKDLARTSSQRRHDALVWMCLRSAQADNAIGASGPDPMIYVHTTSKDTIAAAELDAGLTPSRVAYDKSMRELETRSAIAAAVCRPACVRPTTSSNGATTAPATWRMADPDAQLHIARRPTNAVDEIGGTRMVDLGQLATAVIKQRLNLGSVRSNRRRAGAFVRLEVR